MGSGAMEAMKARDYGRGYGEAYCQICQAGLSCKRLRIRPSPRERLKLRIGLGSGSRLGLSLDQG